MPSPGSWQILPHVGKLGAIGHSARNEKRKTFRDQKITV
jgi:hypothetical protein